jgi:hypothetical protein
MYLHVNLFPLRTEKALAGKKIHLVHKVDFFIIYYMMEL